MNSMSTKGIVSCCSKVSDPGPPFCKAFSLFPSPSPSARQLVLFVSAPSLSPLPIKVLIDSGCTRSFIDQSLVNVSKIKTLLINPPISLRLFDGSVAPSGPITMYADICFSFLDSADASPAAPEHFRFLATCLDSSVQMALGYDWLLARNPLINWRTGQIIPRDSSGTITEASADFSESGAFSV